MVAVIIGGGGFGWAEAAELITGVLNLAVAVVVAWAALRGLDTWRREHRAKRAMELAEQILASGYECLDAVDHMRHGWQPAHEVEQINRLEGESESDYQTRRYFEITFQRYNDHAEKFAALMALRFRAEVLFTADHRAAMEEVQLIANRTKNAAQAAYGIRKRHDKLPDADRFGKRGQELWDAYVAHEDIMATLRPKDQDSYYPKLKEARDNLERLFKPIAAEGTLPS